MNSRGGRARYLQHKGTQRRERSSGRFRGLAGALGTGLAVFAALCAETRSARTQVLNAQIQGLVRSQETGAALAGATVTVQGPAVPAMQAGFTDDRGRYLLTQLPPGDDYVVSFYFGAAEGPLAVRYGVRLSAGKTVVVDAGLKTRALKTEVQRIREAAPNVDVANANTGVEIDQEMLRQTPLRGRSYQSAIFLAPGASDVAPRNVGIGAATAAIPGGDVGTSISGATGAENAYLLDGVNTTDPAVGIVGAELSPYFLKEMSVLTGGYQAEYGRATGGIVSVVTKSGSNTLHGGVYGSWVPHELEGQAIARLGEALQTRVRPALHTWDLGFDLGGPILKDRVWFYVGFAITSLLDDSERRVRTQIFDGTGPRALPDFTCPDYLADSRYCDGARTLARQTRETGYSQGSLQRRALYNGIAKLQFHLREDQDLFLTYLGSPNVLDTVITSGPPDPAAKMESEVNQVHDLSLRYQGKALGKRLQIDLMYALHYQSQSQHPKVLDQELTTYLASAEDPYSLADFEPIPECRRESGTGFNPCPVTAYSIGVGPYRQQELQRHQALAGLTLFVRWLGVHAIKAGLDLEFLRNSNIQRLTGPSGKRTLTTTAADGSDLASRLGFGARIDGMDTLLDGFAAVTQERNYALYLRDSWSVASTGLVLNLGLRWEGTELLDVEGTARLRLLENLAPRVGVVWDFTRLVGRPGRGKLFANYGRFYESVRLDLGDRAFAGQAFFGEVAGTGPAGCPKLPRQPGGRPLPVSGPSCTFDTQFLLGGSLTEIVPGAKPSAVDEVTAGLTLDVGYDLVLGASYLYRRLSNTLEDFSVDQGSTYFLGTPGVPVAADVLAAATQDATRLKELADRPGSSAEEKEAASKAQRRVDAYNGIANYPQARREYNALLLTASKRLSHRISFLASYTYSRTTGNYPGIFSSSNGQLNPHSSSQFDYVETLINRDGPLPTDRPHNFKLTGFYQQPLGTKGVLTAGLTFSAISGRPIEVLGAHAIYGAGEVFILPRGSGGRTPTVTQLDLHVGYEHKLTDQQTLGVFLDVINLLNQREVTNVEDLYTSSSVEPLVDEKSQREFKVKTSDGSQLIPNTNYGQPTAFQAPLYLRAGGRFSF